MLGEDRTLGYMPNSASKRQTPQQQNHQAVFKDQRILERKWGVRFPEHVVQILASPRMPYPLAVLKVPESWQCNFLILQMREHTSCPPPAVILCPIFGPLGLSP
jgi:hypothetical protein